MSKYLDAVTNWLEDFTNQSWSWVDSLDRQEWFVLLVVVTTLGFFCMRGYGSRKGY